MFAARGSLTRHYYALMLYREIQREQVVLPMMRIFMGMPAHSRTATLAFNLFTNWLRPEHDFERAMDIVG